MTERSATGTERQVVCPFVAFDDDRDHRSSVPDHRHRCFAESPSASRALAHQAAYCLSSAFPGCPTFIDWARREAAPPRDEPVHGLRETPSTPRHAERSTDGARRSATPDDVQPPAQRSRRTDWTAPPPWAPDLAPKGAPAAPEDEDVDEAADTAVPGHAGLPTEADVDRGPGLGAWTGSALGALAASRDAAGDARAGEASAHDVPARAPAAQDVPARAVPARAASAAPPDHADRGAQSGTPGPNAPAFLAGRASRSPGSATTPHAPVDADTERGESRRDPARRASPAAPSGEPPRRPVPGRDLGRDRPVDRTLGRPIDRGPERQPADPSAPSWERPRRFEAYPSLKSSGSRVAALPRPLLYGLVILIVAVGLFAAPFLLRGLTGGDSGTGASPTPGAAASPSLAAAASVTPVPSPSPTIYTVKAGDLLSRIAVKFGVTVDQIVKVNPQIKNPDKLAIGDRLVIPPAVAPAITDGTITPAP